MTFATISLLTDLGRRGESVGVLHAIVRDLAPGVTVIDLDHEVDPFDVRAGSLALARALPYLPAGVIVAAVDRDSDRPAVAVEIAGGAAVVIGPDNGLLAPLVAMAGGAERAVRLDRDDLVLASPGTPLLVRDVLVPIAAALCAGTVRLADLGPAVDPHELLPGVIPITRIEQDELVCEVLWVNRYGDVQLNVDPDELVGFGPAVRVRVAGQTRTAQLAIEASTALTTAGLRLVRDPYGLVAITVARQSAALELGVDGGSLVHLAAATDPNPGTVTPVQLRR
jgi:S-adenosylmethionine hydrolase